MKKLSTLATTVLPALIAGGLIFGSARSRADAGGDAGLGFWPATGTGTLLAQAPPEAPEPPEPPIPPEPPRHVHAPRPPRPPRPPHAPHAGHDVQVSIHDGKIEVDGIKDLVGAKLDMVREMLSKNGSIPPDIREKILKRLDKVRGVTDRHLDNIHGEDMEHFGEEMERMGEEIEKSMEGMGSDMERMGEQLGKDFGKKFSKDFAKHFGKDFAKNFKGGNFSVHIDSDSDGDHDDHDADHDDDDDDSDAATPGVPAVPAVDVADDDDMRAAIKDLGSLALRPEQREQIARLRADSDRAVAVAQREMDNLSNRLHDALANPATSDSDIARYVDQISAQESAIRKARILAWADARRVLDDHQRKKVEDTAAKKHGK